MELDKFNIEQKREEATTNLNQTEIAYSCIYALLDIYAFKQEKSIVKIQNKVAISQYLPTNSTLFLTNEEPKREKIKYTTPDNWKDAFKLIKLLWQTRQLV